MERSYPCEQKKPLKGPFSLAESFCPMGIPAVSCGVFSSVLVVVVVVVVYVASILPTPAFATWILTEPCWVLSLVRPCQS